MAKIDQLSKAKAALIIDQPFFASLLLGMPMIEDKRIPTLCTNGEEIRYNPEYLDSLTLAETVFALAHETMHCVFQHMTRRGDRNLNKWNIAADYVINGLLTEEHVGKIHPAWLLNPALVTQGNGTAEGVYAILPEGTESKGPGQRGGALDQVIDAGSDTDPNAQPKDGHGQMDQATKSTKEAEMRVKIAQAANAARMCGKLSAGLDRMVQTLVKSQVDWKSVLRRFLSERAKIDLSYARPKRRFLADDMNLPSLVGERLGGIVIAVDCSGSIDQKTLDEFSAEIRAIQEDTRPSLIRVVYFDAKVLRADSFEAENPVQLNPCGGGGTAFSPVFKWIDATGIPPIACIVLTDLECDDYGEVPGYPVLWASIRAAQTPFGECVVIKAA